MFPCLLIIFSKSVFISCLFVTLVFLGELGMVSQREDGRTCRWRLSQRAVMGDTGERAKYSAGRRW